MNNLAEQVKAALNISGGGSNYRPWSTYTNGAYRRFLDEPLQGGAALPSTFGTAGLRRGPVRSRAGSVRRRGERRRTRSRWPRCPSRRASRTRTATG